MNEWDDVKEVLAKCFKISVEELDAYLAAKREESRRRIVRNNERFAAAVGCMTDVQAVLAESLEHDGYRIIRVFQNRASRKVATMMQKDKVWNGAKGRVGTKLVVIYPNGSRSETFEKSITVRQVF